jgi:C1A family cysteine protease
MKKRGTGWIPDYPDLCDYTLEKDNEKLSHQIQGQGSTTSIETLAKKVCEALDVLADQAQKLKLNPKDLTNLREDLDKEILGGIKFSLVDFYDTFRVGSVAQEVILIRSCLGRIRAFYVASNCRDPLSIFHSSLDPINMQLTPETLESVQNVLKEQLMYVKYYGTSSNSSINFNDIVYLGLLADLISGNFKVLSDTMCAWSNYLESSLNLFEEVPENQRHEFDSLKFVVHAWNLSAITKQLNDTCRNFVENFKSYIDVEVDINTESIEKDLNKIDIIARHLRNSLDVIRDDRGLLVRHREYFQNYGGSESKRSAELIEIFLLNIEKLEKESLNIFLNWQEQINSEIQNLLAQLQSSNITKDEAIRAFSEKFNWNKWHGWESEPLEYLGGRLSSFDFQHLVLEFYKLQLPQLPPQIFDYTRFSLESPIHSDLFRMLVKGLVEKRVLQRAEYTLQVGLHGNIRSTVDMIAQMLMPLGQHSNLSDAVDKTLEKIQQWIRGENEMQAVRKQVIQELLTQQDSLFSKDVFPICEQSLKIMTLLALKQINTLQLDLVHLIDQILEHEGIKDDWGSLLQREQPLFRIRSEGESLKGRKQVQFPISRKLREENSTIQAKLNSEIDTSDYQVNEISELENKPDVYLTLPEFVDLSYWFSPVEDQGSLNSCTAHAGIALIEYAQSKSFGTYIDASPRFLYKVTRNLMQQEGDSGASMRDTMKAMVAFGVCPEEHWRYDEAQFDEEPPAFCYSFAENYKTLKYFRLDHGTISRSVLLAQVKVLLASEMPCAFGFTLYSSVYEESNFARGHIPLPTNRDKVIGGHVVVAVGYHDRKIIKNSDGDQFAGALLIRNSWGNRWGQGGYGWLPYEYVFQGLTADWWSLLKAEWLASGRFGAGASAWNPDQGGNKTAKKKQ